ncbi:alpha/beta hydrolase [bacterium]|nr:MAG: alpha/beta hydrolase [bacterium]
MPAPFFMPNGLLFLVIVLACLALLTLGISWFERRLIYYPNYPSRELVRTPDRVGFRFREISLRTADRVHIHGWLLESAVHPSSGKTLLFFHGNAGNISHRLDKCRVFLDLGLNVLIIDYRGYGQSTGRPTERGTYHDANAAYDYLKNELKLSPTQIVVYGESLGTAVAVDLVSRMPCSGLILEAPFTAITDVAKLMFRGLPIGLLARHRYDSLRKVRRIEVPLLVLHSRQDELFPLTFAERLLEAAPGPKRLVVLNGSHSDGFFDSLPVVKPALRDFVSSLH